MFLKEASSFSGLSALDLVPEGRLVPTPLSLLTAPEGARYLIRDSSTFSSICSRLASSCPRSWLTVRSSSCSRPSYFW